MIFILSIIKFINVFREKSPKLGQENTEFKTLNNLTDYLNDNEFDDRNGKLSFNKFFKFFKTLIEAIIPT